MTSSTTLIFIWVFASTLIDEGMDSVVDDLGDASLVRAGKRARAISSDRTEDIMNRELL